MRPTESRRQRTVGGGRTLLVMAGLSVTACPGPVAAGESAVDLLSRAVRMSDRVAYSGRKVTVLGRGGAAEATITQEYHSGRGQIRLETVMPRRARGRVVIDDGRDRWQYEPGHRLLLRSTSTAEPPLTDLTRLQENYNLSRETRPVRAADRWADLVAITPRVPGKPSRKLWLDRRTGLVLRVEKVHADGSPLSASQFTEIRVGEKLPERLFLPPQSAGVRVQHSPSPEAPLSREELERRFRVTIPASLPAGYRFTGGRLVSHGDVSLAHLRYQDGLSLVSLYLAAPGRLPQVGASGRAAGRPGNHP